MPTHPRVLHVLQPTVAGVPAYVRSVAAEQVRRGAQVAIASPGGQVRAEGAVALPTALGRAPDGLARGARDVSAYARRLRPDVLHLHSFHAALAGRLRHHPGVVVAHQPHAWPFRVPRLGPVATQVERRLAGRSDVVLAVSEAEAAEGTGVVRAPVVTTGVPVDLGRLRPPVPAERERARRSLGVTGLVAVCLGRLSHQKGQDALVAEWVARPAHAGVGLHLVGGGAAADVARLAGSRLADDVHLQGHADDVLPWLWAADVLVQPSRWEGLSIAVVEALACGVPVVATDVAGMVEAIGAGPAAAGTVVGDAAEAVEAVLARLHDPAGRRREGARGPARAHAVGDVRRVVDRVQDAYELGDAHA